VHATDVRRVRTQGRSVRSPRLVLFAVPGVGDNAFVASRRIGGAVQRNRARRILRAAWRVVSPQLSEGFDTVWVARAPIRGTKSQDLVPEMAASLRRLELT
jgi:ribonuclease P protein component